ncbi:Macrolide export ATP-binding/permease protein MacB [Planctomycetes bacterium Poly30]|uniref:Macrolide export ATP-binding/permease protein MacB n=1 Tax=Saltatorellus ferox TaxID=2528018 RepID=A0A518EUT7_9BACT|nr:Macrolide export ATP-binding/permease protein MacB [Planctomycetes bacterium Poly30]
MRFLRLILVNLKRRKGRTALTILGVACALALLVLVESLGTGMAEAMDSTDAARTLVVFRKNRYCPQTSFLPESYTRHIEGVEGVDTVLPVKVYLNNCRASLDLVTFQGAPVEEMLAQRSIEVIDGDAAAFEAQKDAALVGQQFAARKGVRVGQRFRFGDIDVSVVGIFRSDESTQESLILTHLEYLQRAGPISRLGTVTQFEVLTSEGAEPGRVASEIDEIFATAEEPTDTRPRVAYLESATRDLREILRFGRYLALACVVVVLSLVANTVLMSVQERVREMGVLRAIGFREVHVGALVMGEALALAFFGALIGVGSAVALLHTTKLTIGSEGVSIGFVVTPSLVLLGFGVALGAGAIAGLLPAVRSARAGIVDSLGA